MAHSHVSSFCEKLRSHELITRSVLYSTVIEILDFYQETPRLFQKEYLGKEISSAGIVSIILTFPIYSMTTPIYVKIA